MRRWSLQASSWRASGSIFCSTIVTEHRPGFRSGEANRIASFLPLGLGADRVFLSSHQPGHNALLRNAARTSIGSSRAPKRVSVRRGGVSGWVRDTRKEGGAAILHQRFKEATLQTDLCGHTPFPSKRIFGCRRRWGKNKEGFLERL